MMAVNVKQLSNAERAWVDDHGQPINIDRAWLKSDRAIGQRRLDAGLLAAATKHVPGTRHWFALRTTAVSELELCERLTDSDVDAVVPKKKVQVKRRFNAPSRKVVHKPVLRGLVFVCLVPSDAAFAGLLRLRGVASVIGASGRPQPIGDREMRLFMDLADAGAFDERHAATGLQVGSKVKIRVGTFADVEGVLEGYAKGRAARVLVWLFGREHVVDVRLANLEKLD